MNRKACVSGMREWDSARACQLYNLTKGKLLFYIADVKGNLTLHVYHILNGTDNYYIIEKGPKRALIGKINAFISNAIEQGLLTGLFLSTLIN